MIFQVSMKDIEPRDWSIHRLLSDCSTGIAQETCDTSNVDRFFLKTKLQHRVNEHEFVSTMGTGAPVVPSRHQTWLAGKWTTEIGDFSSEINLHSGDFPAMFDETRW